MRRTGSGTRTSVHSKSVAKENIRVFQVAQTSSSLPRLSQASAIAPEVLMKYGVVNFEKNWYLRAVFSIWAN
jgi:hypothetical protein